MKLKFANSEHNIFHWLIVVLLRIAFCLVLLPLGIYLIAIGFLLSEKTLQPHLPPFWLDKTHYLARLPYYQVIQSHLFNRWLPSDEGVSVWWTMVVGLPLMALGVSIFLINFFNLYYAIFSPLYNRTHCPFCQNS